jgi:hypothetical protein
VLRLSLVYPVPQRGADELQELAKIWNQDMAGISDTEFVEAIQEHRRSSQWWPTVSEIVQRCEEQKKRAQRQRQFLPEDTGPVGLSDHERKRNQERVRALLREIGGNT